MQCKCKLAHQVQVSDLHLLELQPRFSPGSARDPKVLSAACQSVGHLRAFKCQVSFLPDRKKYPLLTQDQPSLLY